MISVPRETLGTNSRNSATFSRYCFHGVDPMHFFQDAVGASLEGEMDEFAELIGRSRMACMSSLVISTGWLVMKRIRFKPWDFVEAVEKIVEEAVPFRFIFAVAIDILPKKRDFFVSLVDEVSALFEDAVWMARDFWSAGVGDDAVGAVFVASADDRHIGFDFVVAFGTR